MNQTAATVRPPVGPLERELAAIGAAPARPRHVARITAGRSHGPITRLMSPSDLGERVKPFVFLDLAEMAYDGRKLFGMHPHSGIATLTTVLQGGFSYEDTTGKTGEVQRGGLEWMRAGRGVWHDGAPIAGDPLRAFQLWIALPRAEEASPPESQYIAADDVQQDGPVRVILGRHGNARSRIRAPSGIDYFHVELADGERWRYMPPAGYDVAWLAVDRGRLWAPEVVSAGQLAIFEESESAIEVVARGDVSFVFGSAAKHPHPLVLGDYSVHTTREALEKGEAEIARIGARLQADGRI
jgi:redox-sensitive bicupin YhaK (pirin superfamily)